MSEDVIGRADYELRAPLDPLKKDLAAAKAEIQQTGEQTEADFRARSSKWGPALAAGAKVGVKAVATAAAGMFAFASKGALQLQGVMDRYQADTGATAEEARRAGKVINKVAGDNRMSLEAVGEAAAKVRTDLGAVGDEADKLTGQFAQYARVTRQDAAGAVTAFDDILDNWGLTAADAQSIMDKLIVSHQKYGGEITQNQKTLAQLAPALRAANFQIDDGIALLGLFGAKGLDAEQASAAFAKALTKVKSPAELKLLIADIQATKDPFQRAAKAADLFGSRAGAKLANALDGANIDDFKISMDEAAGATEHAADVLDQSFGAQVQKKISQFGASLRELGTDWGPAITGAASFASVLSVLGIDKALGKAWETAAGSAVVQGLVKTAALKATGVYLAATMAGSLLADTIAGAWTKVSAIPAVKAALEAAGMEAGSSYMAGFMKLVPMIGIALAGKDTLGVDSPQAQELYRKLGEQGGYTFGNGWGTGASDSAPDASAAAATSFVDGYTSVLAAAKPALAKAGGAMGDSVLDGYRQSGSLTKAARQTVWDVRQAIIDGKASIVAAWVDALDARNAAANAKDQIIINNAEIAAAKKVLIDKHATAAEKAEARIRIRNLQASNIELLVEQSNYGTRAEQTAKTKALLTSKALLRGLKDKDPDIRAYWKKVKHDLEVQLGNLDSTGYIYGQGFTRGFIRGLVKDTDRVGESARMLARVVKKYLQVRSPSELGPFSEMGGPEGWSKHWMELYTKGLSTGVPRINGILGGLGGPMSPSVAMAASSFGGPMAGMPSAASSSGSVALHVGAIHISGIGSDVSPAAASRFGHQVLDEVAKGFRQGGARMGITTTVRP